jgi:hypothetical protein
MLREWGQRIVSFTEDRGFFFWLISYFIFILFLSVIENLFGPGSLKLLLDRYKFISLLMFIYVAAHLKIIRNIYSVLRPGYPEPYWTDRLIIRQMRIGTSMALAAGFIVSLVIVRPWNIFALIPAYALIISLFTALYWSIKSFRMDDREFQDPKVQTYFVFLGVRRLRLYRQVSGAYIIGLIVSAGIFYGFMHIPNLYWNLRMNPTLNTIYDAIVGLFSWIPVLWPSQ